MSGSELGTGISEIISAPKSGGMAKFESIWQSLRSLKAFVRGYQAR